MSVTPFTFSGGRLVFIVNGNRYTVSQTDKNFNVVAKALKENKTGEELLGIFNNGTNLAELLKGNDHVTFDGTYVYVDGEILHDSIVQKVRAIADAGLPLTPILKFIENIEKNDSFNSKKQSYSFLEHSDIALTDDGCFIAYRAVQNNYMSKRANLDGTYNRNMVGDEVTMKRSLVDDNPDNHCSQGLHVGSIKYAGKGGFYHSNGDRTMLVKVNPADVVSVPNDFSCQKCRVCKYLVVGEVSEPLETPLYTAEGLPYPVQYADASEFDGFDYEDDYDDEGYSDIYEEDDDYDSEINFDDDDDFEPLPELRL